MTRVRVTIDAITLKGFDHADGRAVVEALKGELARMLADSAGRGEWARSRRTPVLRIGAMPLEAGTVGGRKLGRGLAQAIGRGLKP